MTTIIRDSYLRDSSRHGVMRAATLEQLGVPQTVTYRQCQPGGRWTHLLPGIVLLTKARPTARQRVEAALLHADSLGVVTGFEAARRYGLRNVPNDPHVHLLIATQHHIRSAGFVVIERTKYMPEPLIVDDLPLAPPARAVLDGLRRIRQLDPVRGLLIETKQLGLATYEELSKELESGSNRGTALPRAVLRELSADVRSVAEAASIAVWKRAGLPAPERNVPIYDARGNYIGTPDVWCDDVGFGWEIDSYEHHFGRSDYARTLERNNRYAAAGIIIVQTVPTKLRVNPNVVVAELRAAYHAAQRRPRPVVLRRAAA